MPGPDSLREALLTAQEADRNTDAVNDIMGRLVEEPDPDELAAVMNEVQDEADLAYGDAIPEAPTNTPKDPESTAKANTTKGPSASAAKPRESKQPSAPPQQKKHVPPVALKNQLQEIRERLSVLSAEKMKIIGELRRLGSFKPRTPRGREKNRQRIASRREELSENQAEKSTLKESKALLENSNSNKNIAPASTPPITEHAQEVASVATAEVQSARIEESHGEEEQQQTLPAETESQELDASDNVHAQRANAVASGVEKATDFLDNKGQEMQDWGKERSDSLAGFVAHIAGGSMKMVGAITGTVQSISRGIATLADNHEKRKDMTPAQKQRNSTEMAGKFFKAVGKGITKFASAIPFVGGFLGKLLGGVFGLVEKAVKAIDKAVQKGQQKAEGKKALKDGPEGAGEKEPERLPAPRR